MLRAYRIESSAAVYPRIVVDPELIDQISRGFWDLVLLLDSDGLWFVDPFSFKATIGNASELVADGYDPHELYLVELGRHIENGICNAKQVDHLAKWTWIKMRYEAAHEEYMRTRETKMEKIMGIAEPSH